MFHDIDIPDLELLLSLRLIQVWATNDEHYVSIRLLKLASDTIIRSTLLVGFTALQLWSFRSGLLQRILRKTPDILANLCLVGALRMVCTIPP
jgi:hypothetical protein